MFEKDININDIKEIRTRTTVYFGVGAIKKIDDIAKILKTKGIDKVIVMSGRNAYKATGAWDYVEKALKDNSIGYINYDQVTPNPTTEHVNEAAKMARDFGAKAVTERLLCLSTSQEKTKELMADLSKFGKYSLDLTGVL